MTTVQRTMCSITVAPLMNQFFIFLYYHFLAYFEKLACTLPYYTFLRPLFHNCNTFTHLLLHSRYTYVTPLLTPLLHICYTLVTHFLRICYTPCNAFVTPLLYTFVIPVLRICYTVLTLIMTFWCILILWHFVRVWFVAFCPGFVQIVQSIIYTLWVHT